MDFAKHCKDKVSVKLCVGNNPGAPLRVEVMDGNRRRLTMIAMPLKEPGLVNKVVNAVLANCVNEITQTLETATAGIEALLQPNKKSKGKEPAANVLQAQGMTQAA